MYTTIPGRFSRELARLESSRPHSTISAVSAAPPDTAVALLVTYFNEGPLLRECLESLRPNLRPGDEVVLHDDASHDRPEQHLPDGIPVRILRSERNIGPAAARNKLWRATDRPWMHFQDADDLVLPHWRSSIAAHQGPGADAILTEVQAGGLGHGGTIMDIQRLVDGGDLFAWAADGCLLSQAATYRRVLLERLGGYREDMRMASDFEFGLRLALSGAPIALEPRPGILMRLRAGSLTFGNPQRFRWGVVAIGQLSASIPRSRWGPLSDRAHHLASLLLSIGDEEGAAEAFEIARRLGPPPLVSRRPSYRAASRLIGSERAERISQRVRVLLGKARFTTSAVSPPSS